MERLESFEEFFRKQQQVNEVPDGQYQVTVVETQATESLSGDPQIRLTLEIMEGKFTGTYLRKNYTIRSEASVSYLYSDVEKCDIRATSLADLFENHSRFLGLKLVVAKVSKDEHYSVYFRSLRNERPVGAGSTDPGDVA